MNGHGWHNAWIAVALGVAGFAAGVIWSLNANDAAQTQQLMDLEARAVLARGSIVDTMERLTDLERKVALLEQRVEARP